MNEVGSAVHPDDAETIEVFRANLKRDRPGIDTSPILSVLRDFARWRGIATALSVPPPQDEVERYHAHLSMLTGDRRSAAALSRLQTAAVVLWGVPYARMIGTLLRRRLVVTRETGRSKLDAARALFLRLPPDWQTGLLSRLRDESGPRKLKWSDEHAKSVAQATLRWIVWCGGMGHDGRPSGQSFHAYAQDLARDGVSTRSAGDYLGRILSGYRSALEPDFSSAGCDHVISRLNAQAKREGSPTKTGDQLVGASAIFELGFHLIDGARSRGPRSISVARDYRNGLLLALAAAVPQRARALSHFRIGSTVVLLDRPHLRVRLPGRVLKALEHEKDFRHFDRVFANQDIWDALDEYCREFRPLFDDGAALFPSTLDVGEAISSAQIGCIAGNLTAEHLGVRISVHRVRDNVATEASEQLEGGGYLGPALLGHTDASTTMASYDHAEGIRAAKDYGDFLGTRRSVSARLRI